MIKANLSAQTRAMEARLLVHAKRLSAAHFKRRNSASGQAWRNPALLWPDFSQD